MAYEILSVNSGRGPRSYECFPQFLRSCDRHSMRPIFLQGEWRGMTSKIKFLWRYLQENMHTGSIVLFCDSFDVVFGNPALKKPNDLWPEMTERFRSFGVPFVANAEKNCFPYPERALAFESFVPKGVESPFKYLNSGFFIAAKDALIEILRWMKPDQLEDDFPGHHPADQEQYQAAFLAQREHGVPMKLDYEGLLCTATHDVQVIDLEFRPVMTDFGIVETLFHGVCQYHAPMAWHFNGSKNHAVMSTVLKSLRL